MHSFLSTAVRCLLALVLVCNGALAQAHAHMRGMDPSASEASASRSGAGPNAGSMAGTAAEMPCHADIERGGPAANEHPAPHKPDGCCGSHCVCGCVFASVLPTLARIAVVDRIDRERSPLVERAFVAQRPSRLLRPPIA